MRSSFVSNCPQVLAGPVDLLFGPARAAQPDLAVLALVPFHMLGKGAPILAQAAAQAFFRPVTRQLGGEIEADSVPFDAAGFLGLGEFPLDAALHLGAPYPAMPAQQPVLLHH